jgi:hypothetical protein
LGQRLYCGDEAAEVLAAQRLGDPVSQNRLKIKADSLDLELTGDAEYVREAYEAIRAVVVQRFEQTLRASDQAVPMRPRDKRKTTQPLYRIDGVSRHMKGDTHLRLVVCNDLYHKVALLTRKDFSRSVFGSILDPEGLESVFIDEGDVEELAGEIEVGKTLWRELTATGKKMVHGNSS